MSLFWPLFWPEVITRLRASKAADKAVDFTSSFGRQSGRIVSKAQIARLELWLANRNIELVQGKRAKNFLDSFTETVDGTRSVKNGAFLVNRSERKVYLRANATFVEIYHELGHVMTLRLLEKHGFGLREYNSLEMATREYLASLFALNRPNSYEVLNTVETGLQRLNLTEHAADFQQKFESLSPGLKKVVQEFIDTYGE